MGGFFPSSYLLVRCHDDRREAGALRSNGDLMGSASKVHRRTRSPCIDADRSTSDWLETRPDLLGPPADADVAVDLAAEIAGHDRNDMRENSAVRGFPWTVVTAR